MQVFDFKSKTPVDLTALQIEGVRVFLRSIDESFCAVIFREFTSEITKYMYPQPAVKIEDTLSFIHASIKGMRSGWDLSLAIIKKKKSEFLGCCGFHGRGNPKTPELGIWIKKEAQGQKYGIEAIKTLTSWAVDTINFDYAVYPVDRANLASRKIPEALGGIIFDERKVGTMSGGCLDEVVYRIPYDTLKNNQA